MRTAAIDTRLDRIDKKLNTLLGDNRKHQWVKVSFILLATGWDKEKLRQARNQSLVKWEKRKDGFWYDLSSIPSVYLKHPAV